MLVMKNPKFPGYHDIWMSNAIPVIRRAVPDDLEGILDLYTHLHDSDHLASLHTCQETLAEICSFPGSSLYLLELSGVFVSSCMLFVLPNLSRGARPYGLVENVVTRKEYRGRGFATQLLARTLQDAWDAGCYKVMLLTGRNEDYVFRLYEKAGFVRGKKEGLIAYPCQVL